MGNQKKTTKKIETKKQMGTGATARDPEFEAQVLFQRIYNKWYAFSVVEDDCLVTEVPNEEISKRLKKTVRPS